jgi:hypothetical protein
MGWKGSPRLGADHEHRRSRLGRDCAALRLRVADEDQRPRRRVELVAADGEGCVATDDDVQLLVPRALVVLLDHDGAGLAGRPGVDPERLDPKRASDRRPAVRQRERRDRRGRVAMLAHH